MTTAYDEVVYPNAPFAHTTPVRLGVTAALFGRDFGPADSCRMLEVGCGDGGNIIPLAAAWPGSQFVGFDIAETRIAAGRRRIETLGLGNIRLETLDILDPGELGSFDYIVAHGVYAWVPAEVQEGLMALLGRMLSPRGVAFVSYNALPGGRIRQMVREMVLHHLRGVPTAERLAQARLFLQALIDGTDKEQPFEAAVRQYAETMLNKPPNVLFHDELNACYNPAYLTDFVAHAGRHGLQYLAEAEPFRIEPALPAVDSVRGLMAGAAPDPVDLHQYSDFFAVETFRQSLLVRAEPPVVRQFDGAVLRRLHAASKLEPDPEVEHGYRTPIGAKLQTREPRMIALLERFAALWPQSLPLAEVDADMLPELLRLHLGDVIELYTAERPFVVEPGERPRVFSVARAQAADGEDHLVSLAHRHVEVSDEAGRAFVQLLDGTRTRREVAEAMAARLGASVEAVAGPMEGHLRALARRGLLEA